MRAAQISIVFPPDKLSVRYFAVAKGKFSILISLGSTKLPRAFPASGPHNHKVAMSWVRILISAFKLLSSQ